MGYRAWLPGIRLEVLAVVDMLEYFLVEELFTAAGADELEEIHEVFNFSMDIAGHSFVFTSGACPVSRLLLHTLIAKQDATRVVWTLLSIPHNEVAEPAREQMYDSRDGSWLELPAIQAVIRRWHIY